MNKKLLILLILVCFLFSVSVASAKMIKIGGVACLTGGAATYGASTRNGCVLAFKAVNKEGGVDIMLAFEKLEAVRWLSFLRPGGVAIVNSKSLPPLSVSLGVDRYPADAELVSALKQNTDRAYLIDGEKRAQELGNLKALNVFMLGCASVFMPFSLEVWKDCIRGMLPERIRDINLTAFGLGRKELAGVNI